MFERIRQVIQNSKLLQFGLVLLLGIAVGAIFYPTKHIEERLKEQHQVEITTLKEQHSKEMAVEVAKETQLTQQYSSLKVETTQKIASLTTEVSTLKNHQKTSYFKIVHPDGTIEIKKFSESESEASTQVVTQIQQEFKQKVDSIETKWETIHKERVTELTKEFTAKEQDYKKQIDILEKSKVTDINKKSFGVEAGLLLDKTLYGHATYDVFGPFFLGLQANFGSATTGGAGIGIHL